MRLIELVQFNAELLEKLQKAGVKLDDWRYVSMVKDYEEMVRNGAKKTYAVIKVSEIYSIHPKTVYNLMKRLCEERKFVASE